MTHRLRTAALATLAGLLTACGGETTARQDPFFFIQLSDPQFGLYAENSGFLQETANLEMAVATANRLRPAFVIVTGDMINQTGNQEQIAEYMRVMSKLDDAIPVYHLPGNHDIGNEPTSESIAAYRKRFGTCHYTFRHGDFVGIVLNSSLIASPKGASDLYDEQEGWLRKELEKARRAGARHIVVFQHHPWYVDRVDEADGYSNIPRARRARYLALFREFGVRTLVAGHNHSYSVARDTTFHMVSSGSVGKPFGDGRSGLAVVSVTGAGIDHRYYDFGALPSTIPAR